MYVSRTINLGGRNKNKTLVKLREVSRNVNRDIEIATKITAKQGLTVIAREIQSEIGRSIIQRDIKKRLTRKKLANGNQMIQIAKSGRYPLKMFKPTQSATGVSYKMRETKTIPSAFMGPTRNRKAAKLRGHVWKRVSTHGNAKYPITPLYGASPWGVMNPSTSRLPLLKFAAAKISLILNKQIEKRLKYRLHLLTK